MKIFKKRDLRYRAFFKKNEFKLLFFKILLRTKKIRRFYKKNYFSSNTNPQTKINNSCVLTGRVGGVFKHFKVSRMVLKGMHSVGYLPGVKKSSW